MWDTTCLTTIARSIGPGYIQDIPEIAAPTMRLDPMEIDYFLFEKDGLVMELKDTRVYGLKNLIIDSLRFVFLLFIKAPAFALCYLRPGGLI